MSSTGICAASISTANAYIADITPAERRAASYGLIGAAFGLGFVAGPALGGFLASVDPRLPFWVAAGLSLANALYGLLILPESLPPEHRKAFSWRRANPLASIHLLVRRPGLLGLASAAFLSQLDPWWNPAVEAQAADRAHRIGQDKPVFVYKLVIDNSVEEKMLAMQERKRALAEGVYSEKTGEEVPLFDNDTLQDLFAPL